MLLSVPDVFLVKTCSICTHVHAEIRACPEEETD